MFEEYKKRIEGLKKGEKFFLNDYDGMIIEAEFHSLKNDNIKYIVNKGTEYEHKENISINQIVYFSKEELCMDYLISQNIDFDKLNICIQNYKNKK